MCQPKTPQNFFDIFDISLVSSTFPEQAPHFTWSTFRQQEKGAKKNKGLRSF